MELKEAGRYRNCATEPQRQGSHMEKELQKSVSPGSLLNANCTHKGLNSRRIGEDLSQREKKQKTALKS